MSYALPPWCPQQFFDANGDPVASGTAYFYAPGTTTGQQTYSDTSGTLNANPGVPLNSQGRPTSGAIYLDTALGYKLVLKDSLGATISTYDPLYTPAAAGVDITGTAGEIISAGQVVYLSDGSGGKTAGRWYLADADFVYASTTPEIGIAPNGIANGSTGTIRLGGTVTGLTGLATGTQYYVSSTAGALTATNTGRFVGQADSTTSLVLTPNPSTGNFQPAILCQGRLTGTTAVPVTTADVTAATSIFFTPYGGNQISLYTGVFWVTRTFTEITISVVGKTASTPYDVFAADNAGTVICELLAWTNTTTRATALTTQNGVLVKSGDATRRYLGTVFVNASGGQTDDSLAKRYIWNYYNRMRRVLRRLESTGSWTYTTATIRQANGAAANQVEVMVGVAEVQMQLSLLAQSNNTNADILRDAGFGEDSTTTYMAQQVMHSQKGSLPLTNDSTHHAHLSHFPAIGRHAYSWNEDSAATGTTTWRGVVGSGAADQAQYGIEGSIDA